MAATSSGSSGVTCGRNRASTVPSGPTRNFSKFHSTSPASPHASPGPLSPAEDAVYSYVTTMVRAYLGQSVWNPVP